jgi:aminoglycoside phosphotransferase (APT) family kinase protein
MIPASLSPEQLSTLVHQVFADADIVSSKALTSSNRADLVYQLQLSNLVHTDLKVYSDASAADLEVRLLRMMTNETGVPVPRVLHFAEQMPPQVGLDVPACSWALLARLPGQPLSEVIDTLDDWESESIGYEMGRYLGHIHQIPLDEFGTLFAASSHSHSREKGYVLSQLAEWLETCATEDLLPKTTLDTIQHRFAGTDLLDRRRACLIHGNLAPGNIVVERGATGYHVTGITGFTDALGGSPELDMSKLLVWRLQNSPGFQKGFLDGYTEAGELGAKFWERLALYQMFVSLGSLCHAHQQGWPEQVQSYRSQVDRYLDELGRQSE